MNGGREQRWQRRRRLLRRRQRTTAANDVYVERFIPCSCALSRQNGEHLSLPPLGLVCLLACSTHSLPFALSILRQQRRRRQRKTGTRRSTSSGGRERRREKRAVAFMPQLLNVTSGEEVRHERQEEEGRAGDAMAQAEQQQHRRAERHDSPF